MLSRWPMLHEETIGVLLALRYNSSMTGGGSTRKFLYQANLFDNLSYLEEMCPQITVKKVHWNHDLIIASISLQDLPTLDSFFQKYLRLYREHVLVGQETLPTANYLAERFLLHTNAPDLIHAYGDRHVSLKGDDYEYFHHTVLDLINQGKIDVVDYNYELETNTGTTWLPVINNYSIHPQIEPLPEGVGWYINDENLKLIFPDGKNLTFKRKGSKSARYFAFAMERRGLPIKRNEVMKYLGIIDITVYLSIIKSLRKMIKAAKLTDRVSLTSTKKAASYTLKVA